MRPLIVHLPICLFAHSLIYASARRGRTGEMVAEEAMLNWTYVLRTILLLGDVYT